VFVVVVVDDDSNDDSVTGDVRTLLAPPLSSMF